jgi:hypothetical protein
MKPGYEPKNALGIAGWILEECGEVMQCVGKAMRFGLDGTNPDLPEDERETNGEAIVREAEDLWRAIVYAGDAVKNNANVFVYHTLFPVLHEVLITKARAPRNEP